MNQNSLPDTSILEDLRALTVLDDLTAEQLEHLAAIMIRKHYSANQIIFLEGDESVGLWFIVQGRVRIVRQSFEGRVQALCLANRGTCFGGCPLFDGAVNPANAQALDDVTLLILPSEHLRRLVRDDFALAGAMLRIFGRRLNHLAHLAKGLGIWSTATRINDSLLAYADPTVQPPVVALTHEKLASLAGTVREVVTRHLTQLEAEGVVQIEPGRVLLLDLERLQSRCLMQGGTSRVETT